MELVDDLTSKVQELARERWEAIRDGYVVPSADSLAFGNTGVPIDATVLCADICGSTELVDSLPDTRAAEYYKAFLHCAAKVVKAEGGTITAYDGDRLMAIVLGETQATDAIRAALKISSVVVDVINPEFLAYIGTANKNCSSTLLESLPAYNSGHIGRHVSRAVIHQRPQWLKLAPRKCGLPCG